jgi:cardiolipin synthase
MLRQIPNALTIARILLVLPFALYLLDEQYQMALLIFFIAGVSDGVDGFLARQFKWRSRFGAIADPLADKLLLVTTYLALAWLEIIPVWLVALIFGRDLIIVIGGLFYHYRVGRYEIQPTMLGKLCTFIQIAFVIWVLLNLAGYSFLSQFQDVGVMLVCLITAASGLHYFGVWILKAHTALSDRSEHGD